MQAQTAEGSADTARRVPGTALAVAAEDDDAARYVVMQNEGLEGAPGVAPDAGGITVSPVLTAAEVAKLLRLNVKTIYELAQRGELPGRRVGRSFRFHREAVEAMVKSHAGEGRVSSRRQR